MKGTYLGEFEELVLLAVGILFDDAYGLAIVDELERAKNRTKASVRAKVEHSIGVIKRVFGFTKTRYRGLAKNTQRLWVSCGLANLFIARHQLLRA